MKQVQASSGDKIHTFPLYVGAIFCIFVCGHFGLIYIIDEILPTPLMIIDENNYPNEFIAERASNDLKVLTEIGSRVTGTYENEVSAVGFLSRQILQIIQQSNKKIEMDVQVVSNMEMSPYVNVQNIVVKLYAPTLDSNNSLLINSHFDSVAGSPGGSDDGINCAVMLEILRKLSRSEDSFQHNILFLFNGAEEQNMLASHGFMKHHKWAKEAKVVINLEAAGAAGKIMLFQTGPHRPWLLDYYQSVPYPFGSAVGEELFQTGLLPAATDFNTFVNLGDIIGFDFAFVKNGYRYHTSYDGWDNIPLGSYQHVGANTLALVRSLANSPELSMSKVDTDSDNMVYFDFFSLFLISYSETVAVIINDIVSLASLAIGIIGIFALRPKGWSSVVYVLLVFIAIIFGWILATVVVFGTALILDTVGYSMSWYGNPWILFGLYIAPTFASLCFFIVLLNIFYKNNPDPSRSAQIQAHVIRLIWTFILIIATMLNIRSAFLILIAVVFQTCTFITIHLACLHNSIRKWQIVYVCGTIIPNLFLMQQALMFLTFMIPICGRLSSDAKVELYIGILTLFFALLILPSYVLLVTLVRKSYFLLAGFFGVFVVFVIIVFTPLGFPYSGNIDSPAPQRFFAYQLSRTYHNDTNIYNNKESAFLIEGHDRNSNITVLKYLPQLRIDQHADTYSPSRLCTDFSTRKTYCIPATLPIPADPINIHLVSKINLGDKTTRFTFRMLGSNNMELRIKPQGNSRVRDSSLPLILENKDEKSYLARYTFGIQTEISFWIDIQENHVLADVSFLDIDIVKIYPYKSIDSNTEFGNLMRKFPDWVNFVTLVWDIDSFTY